MKPMLAETAEQVDPELLVANAPAGATAAARAVQRVVALCGDDRWALEQKADGRRLVVHVDRGEVAGFNRRGERADVPGPVRRVLAAAGRRAVDVWFDGEVVGGATWWVFDAPAVGGVYCCDQPWENRQQVLDRLFDAFEFDAPVCRLPAFVEAAEKLDVARRLVADRAEGLMFKAVDSRYEPGVRSKRWLKVKFTGEVDCHIVEAGRDGKQNFVLAVYRDDGEKVEVAEVTALAGDGPRLKVGDVCTVRVLYVTADDRLYQPNVPRRRTDKLPAECGYDQLDPLRTNKRIVVPEKAR